MANTIRLSDIAYARSGDKGADANVGIIARTLDAFELMRQFLTEQVVEDFFKPLGVTQVVRYELPNLQALNFVLVGILGGGGSVSLRNDAQGKALGQQLLEMKLQIPGAEAS